MDVSQAPPVFQKAWEELTLRDDELLSVALGFFMKSKDARDKGDLQAAQGSPVKEGTDPSHLTDEMLVACSLYVALRQKAMHTVGGTVVLGCGVTLSQLMRATRVRAGEFFRQCRHFLETENAGKEAIQMLAQAAQKYGRTNILHEKFRRVAASLFVDVPPATEGPRDNDTSRVLSFGWDLFIYMKGRHYGSEAELVASHHLLLCVLAFLAQHAPPATLAVPLTAERYIPDDWESAGEGKPQHDVLRWLCSEMGSTAEDVRMADADVFRPFLRRLVDAGMLSCDPLQGDSFPNMLQTHLKVNVKAIRALYEEMYRDEGDVDERLFMTAPESIVTPLPAGTSPRRHPGTSAARDLSSEFEATYRGPMTPLHARSRLPQGPHASPLSSLEEATQWLKSTLRTATPKPGAALQAYFKQCEPDPTEAIVRRAEELTQLVELPRSDRLDRHELALKLYYRVLLTMLQAEEKRLGSASNFSALLNSESLHKGLLVCCFEMIISSFKLPNMQFPYLLTRFNIDAFSFCKVIESFVLYSSLMSDEIHRALPRAMAKHMSEIEEMILEKAAWDTESPLHALLTDGSPYVGEVDQQLGQADEATSAPQEAAPAPASHIYTASPFRGRRVRARAVSPGPGSATTAIAIAEAPARAVATVASEGEGAAGAAAGHEAAVRGSGTTHSLELFFRKLLHLLFVRLMDLCGRIHLSQQLQGQIWRTLLHLLRRQRVLLWDRHVDQMLLCTVYGVARATGHPDVSFKRILNEYQKQPQQASRVYKQVMLRKVGDATQYGDIIKFYNDCYLPAMKDFILTLQEGQQPAGPPSTPDRGGSAAFAVTVSPKRVGPLLLSPMRSAGRSSKRKRSDLIPGQKAEYNFGNSPARMLQSINDKLKKSPGSNRTEPQRLEFDEEDGDGRSRKRPRVLAQQHEDILNARKFGPPGFGQP